MPFPAFFLFFEPVFVVMSTTPLAAREPYKAAAAAPFNTFIDSISLGSSVEIPLP